MNQNQVMALAGVYQCASLVFDLAKTDKHSATALRASMQSLLRTDADSTAEIYGGVEGLRLGMPQLAQALQGRLRAETRDVIGYCVAMDDLARRLKSSSETQAVIGSGLEDFTQQFSHWQSNWDDDVEDAAITHLAALYRRSLSLLPPQIMVQGSPGKMSQSEVVTRIRVALFAGVRSAYMWRQLGGNRWQLLLRRGAILQALRQLQRSA